MGMDTPKGKARHSTFLTHPPTLISQQRIDVGVFFPVFRVGTPTLLRGYLPHPGTTNLHSSDCSSSIPR